MVYSRRYLVFTLENGLPLKIGQLPTSVRAEAQHSHSLRCHIIVIGTSNFLRETYTISRVGKSMEK